MVDRALLTGSVSQLLLDDAGIYQPMSQEGFDGYNVVGIQSSSLDLLRQVSITSGAAAIAAGLNTITPSAMSGTTDDGVAWFIAPGSTLLVDVGGANQEAVEVLAVGSATFQANFKLTHAAGVTVYVDTFFRTRQAPGQRGAVLMSSDGYKATYRYASIGNTPAATPTDLFTINGSATKTVRVKSIKLNGVATAAGNMPVALIRRSTADTGGTVTNPTPIKHDTLNDANATASLGLYTANPAALGTVIGTNGIIAAQRLFFAVTATGQPFPTVFDFATRMDKALILRGAADQLAVNLQGAAVPAGGVVDIEIEWEEDLS